jgi:hypothetical protein
MVGNWWRGWLVEMIVGRYDGRMVGEEDGW